jgi:hypothetical protein
MIQVDPGPAEFNGSVYVREHDFAFGRLGCHDGADAGSADCSRIRDEFLIE